MSDTLSNDLIYVFGYCLAGLAFAIGPFVIVALLAARKTLSDAPKNAVNSSNDISPTA